MIFESQVPQDRRQEVAGLIKAATQNCELKKAFYAVAGTGGLLAGVDWLKGRKGVNEAMREKLRTEILEMSNHD